MKIEFCKENKGYEEVIELLKQNHPNRQIEIKSCIECCDQCKNHVVAKIGNTYLDGIDAQDLYDKIIDHYFNLPNCFIG